MDQKQHARFDAQMRMAEFLREKLAESRTLQWRGTFGVWAVMLGIATVMKEEPTWSVIVTVIVVILAHAWWVKQYSRGAAKYATDMWSHYVDAEKTAGVGAYEIITVPRVVAWIVPTVVTIIFGILVVGFNLVHGPGLKTIPKTF